jgi:transcriptional regulator with XRE-family HTH domain
MILGEKIRLARLSRNYTQESMATMLEISPTAYRMIEKKDNISSKRLNQISNAIKMTEEEISSMEERVYLNSFNGNNNIVNSQILDAKALLSQIEKKNLEIENFKLQLGLKDSEIENLRLRLELSEEKMRNIIK